jgi:hypothetical protein
MTDIVDLARGALLEITPSTTVGQYLETVDESDGVVSVLFANRMAGYPGWRWTVSVARVEGDEPTVLEVELMPAEGSLLAPDWVPWSERLADYRAQQHDTEGDESSEDDSEDELGGADDDSEDDESDSDASDDDDDESDDDDDDDDDESDDDESDEFDDDLDDDDFDEDDLVAADEDDVLDGVDVEAAASEEASATSSEGE